MPKRARSPLLIAGSVLFWIVAVGAGPSRQHIVVPGDTLSGIAVKYDVSIAEIVRRNEIPNPDLILEGQQLEIPGGEASAEAAPSGQSLVPYVVKPGDTLSDIAFQRGLATSDLQALNALQDPELIAVGQTLLVPANNSQPSPPDSRPLLRPSSPKLESIIDELATGAGLDPRVIKAIAWVESAWDQGAVSPTGAVGVMQLQPATIWWLESEVFHHELNGTESMYDNVKGGVRLFRILLDETGDEDSAIIAYYQGLSPTRDGRSYNDSRRYLEAVKIVRQTFWP